MIAHRIRSGLLAGVALAAFIGVAPMQAKAQFAVIDITAIIQAVRAFGLQVSQLATEIKTEIQTELNGLTEIKQLAEEVRSAAYLGEMVANFVQYPSLGAAMGMMNLVGLDMALPSEVWAVQGMLSGYGGMNSVGGILGKFSMLSSLIPGSYQRDHYYTCQDNSFACVQSEQRAVATAGYKGSLMAIYQKTNEHNAVLNGLRDDMNSSSPKKVMDATGAGVVELGYATNQLIAVNAVNGLAQAQRWTQEDQANQKLLQSADRYLAANPEMRK